MRYLKVPQKIKFTKEYYQKMEADFKNLTKKREGAVINLRTAREMGDLSENGAYHAARFELSSIDRELRRLTYLLRFGEVVETVDKDYIDFGNRVTLDDGKQQFTFTLVSKYEADPSKQKLSIYSPIGRAIMGKRRGDKVIVNAPAGQKTYTIVAVD